MGGLRVLALGLGLVLGLLSCGDDPGSPSTAAPEDRPAVARYAGSPSCRDCHPKVWEDWAASHHALAERELDERDAAAFRDQPPLQHGSLTSEIRASEGRLELLTEGLSPGEWHAYEVTRAIGVKPLRQYLVETEEGRLQTAALSYDPARDEWFDVFGDEDRRPHEWGHWTRRGMNWNAMCADCHNTDVRKGYDSRTDRYDTRYVELGVGCESCHGPSQAHVDWQIAHGGEGRDPHLPEMTKRTDPYAWVDACGACHARRGELRDVARPGDVLLDAFLPAMPGLHGLYHADGKVLEEDYEWSSFKLSRMAHNGVTCLSCHDPHKARPRKEGNALCMQCHSGRLSDELGPIDPAAHSHHVPGTPGGNCVDCHMPLTTYMQRHPRRDHSFSIPDPRLTAEHGIPNACNDCHAEQTAAWATQVVEEWYGDRMDRPYRRRARLVARARAGDLEVVPELVRWLQEEPYPAWRAVAASCLRPVAGIPAVLSALVAAMEDEDALVRTFAVRALEDVAAAVEEPLRRRLDDPVRAVRVTAAWNLRAVVDLGSLAGQELEEYIEHNCDQPTGLAMKAQLALERGSARKAAEALRKAAEWDPGSSEIWRNLSVALAGAGELEEARAVLEQAVEQFPRDASLWFSLGLARYESGDPAGSAEALRRTSRLDSSYPRVWYNLGFVLGEAGERDEAMHALQESLRFEPRDLQAWLLLAQTAMAARAFDRARQAAQQALQIDPEFAPAQEILRQLGGR